MKKKMTLEEYEREIYRHLTGKLHFSAEVAENLMNDYRDRFREYYEENWSVALAATAMTLGD